MSSSAALRVETAEYAPYYGTYIGPIADQDITTLLTSQAHALDSLGSLDDAATVHRYAPDKWSVKEVVGHMVDAERVFAYRMLRIARADTTPLAGFDQEPYVETAHFDSIPISKLVGSFRATRASTLALMGELDDDAWPRMGVASGFPVSARALAYIIAGHATHHIKILREKYGVSV
ncbi:MAG: DinB family protein [Gemmatimonadaceae bacterium]